MKPVTKHIKGPSLLESLFSLKQEPFLFMHQWMLKYGDVINFTLGKRICIVGNADTANELLKKVHKEVDKSDFINKRLRTIFGNGIIVSEGDLWLSERRLIQPVLHKKSVANYESVLLKLTTEAIEKWRLKCNDGEATIDLNAEMKVLMIRIIGITLFGFDNQNSLNKILLLMEEGGKILSNSLPVNLPKWIPRNSQRRLKQLNSQLETIIRKLIEESKEISKSSTPNLLSVLLSAKDQNGQPLKENLVIDEVKSLLLAGIFTTSDSIIWTIYSIENSAKDKVVVLEELSRKVGDYTLTVADAVSLKHLMNCINESMRLYPPVWSMWYNAKEDLHLSKHLIKKNTAILINLYNLHRNPSYFSEPQLFKPNRFKEDKMYPNSFVPFGFGPRKCIGVNLATVAVPLIISQILHNFEIQLVNTEPIVPKVRITLTTNEPLILKITDRKNEG